MPAVHPQHQWGPAKGECGACGDRMGGFRENEYPGKYSQLPSQRTYRHGEEINVTIYTTANLLGYFIFRLCPSRDGILVPDLAECFNSRSPLTIVETQTTKYYPGSKGGFHDLHIVLPKNVSCPSCLLQWTYVTGYRENKATPPCESCLGCGPQEHFVNCADIEILPDGATWQMEPDYPSNKLTTAASPTAVNSTGRPTTQAAITATPTPFPTARTTTLPRTTSTTSPNGPAPCTPLSDHVVCEPRGIQKLIPGGANWCLRNCQTGRCVPEFCTCYCKYPTYKIDIDPSAFDWIASANTILSTSAVPTSAASTSSSSSSAPATSKTLCYKATKLWTQTPGMNGWCKFNCPSEWCQDMCSLQVCPVQ
ncbi:unnamed protein product [Lymnaea stagnalis]|uniref:Chitin-binding type-4 domain-containing protein n=1 Tax=Lymnaea stagnalis TaxID=6523 RepID=A0AAV2H7P9_LYMST